MIISIDPPARRSVGFTLIELLVVVAIIMALLAILLPSIGRAIDITESAVCRSNLRQLHISTMAYGTDHMGIFPQRLKWVLGGSGSPYGPGWYEHTDPRNFLEGHLYPYVRTLDVYLCRTLAKVYNQNPAHAGRTPVGGYSVNSFIGPYHTTIQGVTPQARPAMIKNTSTLMMYADDTPFPIPGIGSQKLNDNAILYGRYNNPGDLVDSIGAFHLPPSGNLLKGNANMAFVDGHADQVHVSQGKELAYPEDFKF